MLRQGCILLFALFTYAPTWAARPFVTDDARLTTAGSCQVESWTRLYRESQELWALPACNPTGNLEFTVGGGVAKDDSGASTTDYLLQGKTLFRPLQTNDWGVGLAIGTVLHPAIQPGPNLLGNVYAYLPVSFSFNHDRLVVHTNVGWLRDRATGRNNLTWGVGSEFQVSQRWLLIAETFGDHRNQPYWQAGARYSILPNLLQVDATVGSQVKGDSNSRWLSFGIRFTPPRLF